MKSAAISCMLFLFFALTAKSQLSMTPQLGLDKSKTSVSYNDNTSFSPLGSTGSLKANLRFDYKFRKGHGPYLGMGTAPGIVQYSFADPASASKNYSAVTSSSRFRLEGGYSVSTKAFKIGKTKTTSAVEKSSYKTSYGCGSKQQTVKSSGCGSKQQQKNSTLNMKVQPSVGFAYIPSVPDNISKGSTYTYNAGNWNTAIVPGIGFEFAKGKERFMAVNFNYTKAIGNLGTETITEIQAGKPVTNSFSSSTSGWSMTVGIPVNLSKSKTKSKTVSTSQKPTTQKQGCGAKTQTYRCGKKI